MWCLEALGPLIHVSRVGKACKSCCYEYGEDKLIIPVSIGINATIHMCGPVLALSVTSECHSVFISDLVAGGSGCS